MKKNDVILVAMAICLILVSAGSVISYQQGYQKGIVSENKLPACNYSVTLEVQGSDHIGYWVGETSTLEKECIVRLDDPGTVIDGGK